MTTIKAVADYAKVSVATVSRVINKSGYVSRELELRVLEAMEALNFHPSALAQSLRKQRSATIGVLIPQLDQPFFSGLTFAIEQTLFAEGYRMLICSAEENLEKETTYVEMLLRQRVDGVILVPTGQSADNVRRFIERQVPVVLVDRDLPQLEGINRVLADNYNGAYEAVRYLTALGHERIGILGAPVYSEPMNHRVAGAKQALADAGLSLDPDLLITDTLPHFDMGFTVGGELIDRRPRPTAIFALTDMMAIGVMHAAAKRGLRVPEDLSIIGFDNIPFASYIMPELTTVAQPIYRMGQATGEMLMRHIEQEDASIETITFETELVVRNSVQPPQKAKK